MLFNGLASHSPSGSQLSSLDRACLRVTVRFDPGRRLSLVSEVGVTPPSVASPSRRVRSPLATIRPPREPGGDILHDTGKWDATWIWKLEEAPGEFAWETSPDDIALQRALREHAVGEEAAKAISGRYQNQVRDSKVIIARALAPDEQNEEP